MAKNKFTDAGGECLQHQAPYCGNCGMCKSDHPKICPNSLDEVVAMKTAEPEDDLESMERSE